MKSVPISWKLLCYKHVISEVIDYYKVQFKSIWRARKETIVRKELMCECFNCGGCGEEYNSYDYRTCSFCDGSGVRKYSYCRMANPIELFKEIRNSYPYLL